MKKLLTFILSICTLALPLSACSFANNVGGDDFKNPGDILGGGGEATYIPSTDNPASSYSNAELSVINSVSAISQGTDSVPTEATQITEKIKITTAGNYYVNGELNGKITVNCDGVTLYLNNAIITNEKKVIESAYALTITLIGESTITNTNSDGSNAIDCDGDLTINGSGKLTVNSTKNAIKGNSISVASAQLNLTAEKDGLHAEISGYDNLTSAPTFTYDDGGYIFVDGATITVNASDDGIQADTFVYIKGDTTMDITAGSGAPSTITETSKSKASGKGIKAGNIDWGDDTSEDTSLYGEIDGDYFILVESGQITINSNDDAVHSNSAVTISGGSLTLTTGDDGIHADDILRITGGSVTVNKSYEGIEAAKLEISGGTVDVTATDDGINAADGTTTQMGVANNNCHIIVSGGIVKVNADGDGIDSNGSMLFSGGEVYVMGPTANNNAALDADGAIVVNGGTLFAAGSLGMVETPASNSQQNVVSYARNQKMSAGTVITLTDSSGTEIMSYTVTKSCQSIILSTPQLVTGNSYSLYGGTTRLTTFTVKSTITEVGSSSNISNPNGRPNSGMGGR